jgi:hypothetical protein
LDGTKTRLLAELPVAHKLVSFSFDVWGPRTIDNETQAEWPTYRVEIASKAIPVEVRRANDD